MKVSCSDQNQNSMSFSKIDASFRKWRFRVKAKTFPEIWHNNLNDLNNPESCKSIKQLSKISWNEPNISNLRRSLIRSFQSETKLK